MKVCVCVYVCMSGGLPPDLHNLSPQNLAWAPHVDPGVPAMVTPSEKTPKG